ncbi:hypothetical protein PPACK8108_LOCUS12445 [Phakopsora pachyrhizi]|uniref:Uncharacterized protein n=1 Tax=Phakopsora pachyrhizi TaxID=170000 RepID=A0AAV0B452_PHAPC|nr:hypothetical protein PPACK8108_LOCUS12445 [Phakopsora pachyrhizi]
MVVAVVAVGRRPKAEMIPDEVWEVLGGNLPYKKIIGKNGSKTESDTKTTVPVESGLSGAIPLQKTFKDEGWNPVGAELISEL